MKKLLTLLTALVLLFSLAACGGEAKDGGGEDKVEKLTLGFIPSQEADEIADTVEPLEKYLTEALGVEVEAEVMIDFVSLVEGMRTGKIDIGFTNPFGYIQAVDRAEVQLIAKAIRNGSETYKAQFVASADSGLKSVDDLVATEGLSWAYPDPLSTSGFLFPASLLMEKGVENLDTHFQQTAAGSHDGAVAAVLAGQADFATSFDDARDILETENPDIKDKVVVIGYTDEIPNDGISVSKDLSDDWVKKIKDAFMAMNDKPEVLEIMKEVYSWDGIAEAKDEEYDVVRSVFSKFEDQLSE
jgi:phosphonate transport system substrate-binding protein